MYRGLYFLAGLQFRLIVGIEISDSYLYQQYPLHPIPSEDVEFKGVNLVHDNSADVSTDFVFSFDKFGRRVEVETQLGTDVNFAASEKKKHVLNLYICWILRDYEGPRRI